MRVLLTGLLAGCGPADDDGDGWPAPLDCDDGDDGVHPSAPEVCNEVDDDCDGGVDLWAQDATFFFADTDGDGAGDGASPVVACEAPSGFVALADDCDDTDPARFPGAPEACNDVDDDCDGQVDEEARRWHADLDGDGFGSQVLVVEACEAPGGYVDDASDCDDYNPGVHPDADERCDGIDNDCDASVDGPDAVDPEVFYADADGDGWGASDATTAACAAPQGYVEEEGDCDDALPDVRPDGLEDCFNGLDDDCSGTPDDCVPEVAGIDDLAAATWSGGLGALAGGEVAVVGDMDGDGLGEVAIGSERYDSGAITDAGAVTIVPGAGASAGGPLPGLPNLVGTTSGASVGMRLAPAGDVDGDGLADLVLGSVWSAPYGTAWLLYGGALPPLTTPVSAVSAAWYGNLLNNDLGDAVSGLGDLDGDGFDDLAIGIPRSGDGGAVMLVYGSATRYAGTQPLGAFAKVVGENDELLASARGIAGADLDGDGLSDAAIGAPGDTVDGGVRVLYGDPVRSPWIASGSLPLIEAGPGDISPVWGHTVAGVGDVNADGYEDLAIADYESDRGPGGNRSGIVWVLPGGSARWTGQVDAPSTALLELGGTQPEDFLGHAVAGVADLDLDGVDDFAVGVSQRDVPYAAAGAVGVFLGGSISGALTLDDAAVIVEGASGSDSLGCAIDAGDLDGDGIPDLVIGGYTASASNGAVYLLLGNAL